jgi:glutamate decarboxylase
MDPNDAIQYVDENTIGIIIIFGSTYTGHFEDVALMSNLREFFSYTYSIAPGR